MISIQYMSLEVFRYTIDFHFIKAFLTKVTRYFCKLFISYDRLCPVHRLSYLKILLFLFFRMKPIQSDYGLSSPILGHVIYVGRLIDLAHCY